MNVKKIKSFNEWEVAITGPVWKLAFLGLLCFLGAAAFVISFLMYLFGY